MGSGSGGGGWAVVRRDGVRWVVREGRGGELPALPAGAWPPAGGTEVSKKKSRAVCRITASGDSPALFLKWFRSGPVEGALKSILRGSGARCEFDRLNAVLALGLEAARPVAYGERRCGGFVREAYLLTEEIPNARRLRDLLEEGIPPADRGAIRKAMAELLRRLADAGWIHRDPHPSNFFVQPGNPSRLVLLDLQPGRFHRHRPPVVHRWGGRIWGWASAIERHGAQRFRMLARAKNTYRGVVSRAEEWSFLAEFFGSSEPGDRAGAEGPIDGPEARPWRRAGPAGASPRSDRHLARSSAPAPALPSVPSGRGRLGEAEAGILVADRRQNRQLLWSIAHEVCRLAREDRLDHLRGRAGRALRTGRQFVKETAGGLRMFRRREYPAEAIAEALRRHAEALATGKGVIKDSRRTHVTRVDGVPGLPPAVLVKEKKIPGSLRRLFLFVCGYSPGLRAWVNSRRLEAHGVPVPRSIAYVRTAPLTTLRARQWLVEEFVEGLPSDRFAASHFHGPSPPSPTGRGGMVEEAGVSLKDSPSPRGGGGEGVGAPTGADLFPARRGYLVALGRFVRGLHEDGIFHLDLKGGNILAARDSAGFRFHVIDLGRVRFGEVPRNDRAFNLGQVYASLLGLFSRAEYLRGFKAYWRGDPTGARARAFLEEVFRVQRGRGSPYSAPRPRPEAPR